MLVSANNMDIIIKRTAVDRLKLHNSPITKVVGVIPKSPAIPCAISADIMQGTRAA